MYKKRSLKIDPYTRASDRLTIIKPEDKLSKKTKKKEKPSKEKHSKEKHSEKVEKHLSNFTDEYAKIRELVGSEAEDFSSDKSSLAMLRSLLSMTIDLIPVAKQAYLDKPNNFQASAVVNLTNQTRELSNDIRNLKDITSQIEHIKEEIIQFSMRQVAQHLIDECYILKKEIDTNYKGHKANKRMKKKLDKFLLSSGKFLTSISDDMGEKIHIYLGE